MAVFGRKAKEKSLNFILRSDTRRFGSNFESNRTRTRRPYTHIHRSFTNVKTMCTSLVVFEIGANNSNV